MNVPVDEDAIKKILANEEYAFLGEPRIRLVAQVYEQLFGGHDLKYHGWPNPALRKELWRLLGPQMRQVSETRIWMVVRRYRDLKRLAIVRAEEAEAQRREEEAKAEAAAKKKAAAEAAAKKKAAAGAASGDAPATPAAKPAAVAGQPAPAGEKPPAAAKPTAPEKPPDGGEKPAQTDKPAGADKPDAPAT